MFKTEMIDLQMLHHLIFSRLQTLSIKAETFLRAFMGHKDVLAVGEVVHVRAYSEHPTTQ